MRRPLGCAQYVSKQCSRHDSKTSTHRHDQCTCTCNVYMCSAVNGTPDFTHIKSPPLPSLFPCSHCTHKQGAGAQPREENFPSRPLRLTRMRENSNLKAHVVHGIMIYHVCVQAHETWHGNMNRALGLKPNRQRAVEGSQALHERFRGRGRHLLVDFAFSANTDSQHLRQAKKVTNGSS